MGEKQKLILDVSEMQMESIRHLFLHSDWEFQPLTESSQEGEFGAKTCVTSVDKEVQTNVDTGYSDLKTDTGDSDNNLDEERFVILQNIDREECPFCLCRPCVTHENNRQSWWEKDPFTPPHPRNSKLRKDKYKRFWAMLYHRGVWSDPRYTEKKLEALGNLQPGQEWHRRDIMPSCVVTLVRTWLPNPKDTQYMGHLWE